jgi:hypothetical protein
MVRRVATLTNAKQPWRFLPCGARVRVENGPLAGVVGVLVSEPESRRLIVSISILQRSIAAVLDDDTQLAALQNVAAS